MAGKAWRLPVQQVVEAIGISGVRQLTLLAITRGPISMMKALPYAHNAMDGLFATRLAAAGFTGPGNAMDWFLSQVQPAEPNLRLDLMPGKFRIGQVGLKRFPLQFELQTVAEAGVNLHAKARERIGAIAGIVVETYPITIERTAEPSRYDPKTRETADHSLPYMLAVALVDGQITLDSYSGERIADPALRPLMRKIDIRANDEFTAQRERELHGVTRPTPARITIRTTDGRQFTERVNYYRGHPRNPLTRGDIDAKLTAICTPRMAAEHTELIRRTWWDLDSADDVSVAMGTLRSW
jgi:2-methylcitrate dehydratase